MTMQELMGFSADQSFTIVSSAMLILMAWGSGKIRLEDKEVIDAHELIVGSVSDADFCERVKLATGKDLRDQLSVTEIEELNKEVKLLRMGNGRN
jgi:hypothetical protein